VFVLDLGGASVGRLFTAPRDLAHIYDSDGGDDGQFRYPDFF